MDELGADLGKLLKGQGLPVDPKDVDNGNEKAEAFEPVTKHNVGYIVSAILINESGQILMMQEAKYTCYGAWYLPAGRMERGENLKEAVKREVLEETGLMFEPTTLISVEMGCGTWYRFNFTGNVTGGKLKTLEEKDKESLQAEWIDWENIKNRKLKLRATDIIKLIEQTRRYYKNPEARHVCCMPTVHPYTKLIHRAVVVHCYWERDVQVLVVNKGQPRITTSYISPYDSSIMVSVFGILKNAIGNLKISLKLCGVLSLEYQGTMETEENHDGICITTLLQVDHDKINDPPKTREGPYQWVPLSENFPSLNEEIKMKLQEHMCVPMINI